MTSPITVLTSPRFTALANVVGVTSLLLSFIFWWDGRSVADVTFYASPIQPAVVLREDLTGDLKLDGLPILGNVYAARLYIWNAGKKSVVGSDILSSFKISAKNSGALDRIISARVVAQSRAEVNATVKVLAKSEIRPEWSLLEDKDGFYLQLVYVAVAPVEWSVEGAIIGQPKISKWDVSITYDSNGKLNFTAVWWKLLIASTVFLFVMQFVAKPYQSFVKTAPYFRKAEGTGESILKQALRFLVVDLVPFGVLGAVLIFSFQVAKTWGAPPMFWF
jgi:hypothetical protein